MKKRIQRYLVVIGSTLLLFVGSSSAMKRMRPGDVEQKVVAVSAEPLATSNPIWVKCSDGQLFGLPQWKIDQIKVLQVLFVHQKGGNREGNPINASMCTSDELKVISNALDVASQASFLDFFGGLDVDQKRFLINTAAKLEATGLSGLCVSDIFPEDIQYELTKKMRASVMKNMSKRAQKKLDYDIFALSDDGTKMAFKCDEDVDQDWFFGSKIKRIYISSFSDPAVRMPVKFPEDMDDIYVFKSSLLGAFNYDNTLFAMHSDEDSKIFIFKIDSHNNAQFLRFFDAPGSDIMPHFHPTKNIFLSAGNYGNGFLGDAETGEVLYRFEGKSDLLFSPDGTKIFCYGYGDDGKNWLFVLDALNYNELHRFPIQKLMKDPVGGRYTSSKWSEEERRFIEVPGFLHDAAISLLAVSPDGKKILVSRGEEKVYWPDHNLFLFDLDTGEIIHRFVGGHSYYITAASFNSDGSKIVSASLEEDGYDDSLCMWSVATGDRLYANSFIVKEILPNYWIRFYSKEKKVILANKIIDLNIVEKIETINGLNVSQIKLLYQSYLASANNITPTLAKESIEYNVYMSLPDDIKDLLEKPIVNESSINAPHMLKSLMSVMVVPTMNPCVGHESSVYSVSCNPKNNTCVSGGVGYSNTLFLWNLNTQKIIKTFEADQISINTVVFSPDGIHFVVGGNGSSQYLTLCNSNTGEKKELRGHSGEVTSVAFSKDGSKIVSGGRGEFDNLFVWDVKTGRIIHNLSGHADGVNAVAFNPDGKQVVSGGNGDHDNLFVWDVLTGKVVNNLLGHKDSVLCVAFSSDGMKMISGGLGHINNLFLWNADSGGHEVLQGHQDRVNAVVFSADGRKIVSAGNGNQNNLLVWNGSGKLLHNLQGHTGSVNMVAFSHNTSDLMIVSGGIGSNNLFVWDAGTGHRMYSLDNNQQTIHAVAFSYDDKKIVSGGGGNNGQNSLAVWNIDTPITDALKKLNSAQLGLLYSFYIKSRNNMVVNIAHNKEQLALYATLPQEIKEAVCQMFNVQGVGCEQQDGGRVMKKRKTK